MKNGFAKKTKVGDIIALEMHCDFSDSAHLKGNYVFMRILFDVDSQYRNNPKAEKQSNKETSDVTYFTWFRGSYLFEIYEGVYDNPILPQEKKVLVPRIFIGHSQFKRHNWYIVGNEEIDVEKINFPETVSFFLNNNYEERQKGLREKINYQWGEISVSKKITETEKNDLKKYERSCVYQWLLTLITDLCWIQGRLDLLTEKEIKDREEYPRVESGFRLHDLLYSTKERNEVYELLNINAGLSYYEFAKSKGFDLKKLYEQ